MKIQRREFMEMVGASVASLSVSGLAAAGVAGDENQALEEGGWRLQATPGGEIISFRNGQTELVNQRLGGNRPRVVIGGARVYSCERPSLSRREGSKLVYRYDFSGPESFSVNYELELEDLPQGMAALKQKVGIETGKKINEGVTLVLPRNLQLPFEKRKVFVPLKNGIGRRKAILGYESEDEYAYVMAGGYEAMAKAQMLAIPMVDEYAEQGDLRLAHCTDPYMSSYFYLAHGEKAGKFNCTYLGQVGVEKEERVVYTIPHRGGERGAMEVFYFTSLGDVEPAPDWQHEVAMVDFDYFSKNGRGWFSDIDTLEKLIAPADRPKVFLTMMWAGVHQDQFSFNWRTRTFEKEWTIFPKALDPRAQSLPDLPDNGTGITWSKRGVKALRPVTMTVAEVHRRIRYAKEKGFRVGLYFADGTNSDDGLKDFDPHKVLHYGGWVGPDVLGKTYTQNPLHPEVREFYLRFIQGLLAEFRKEVDGYIWDETFVVSSSDLGTEAAPGYASRAMMTLVKEVAAEVANFSPELALFASDDIGAFWQYEQAAPYCLMAHGTYQDSWCTPAGWSYGLFPNYRNALWSCNWAAVTRFKYSRYAVETFDVPVPITNGPFGDDVGISDMSAEQQRKVMELFNKRKQRRMEISWVEQDPWNPRYQGKAVEFKE